MRTLIIFDSTYGNTQKVAETVARELGGPAVSVAALEPGGWKGAGLLVLGSPINGWRPSERMLVFLAGLTPGSLSGVKAAAFDTRIRFFLHGDAASRIAKALESAGAEVVVPPEAFIVKKTRGPLVEGELDRARDWALGIKTKAGR